MQTHTEAQKGRLLTVGETATRLRVHPMTVRKMIVQGRIPALQLGGPGSSVRIDAGELECWLYADPADPLRPVDDPAERTAPNSSSSRSAVEAVPLAGLERG